MKPNAVKMLHLNEGHLLPGTLDALKSERFQKDFLITPLPFGSYLTMDTFMSQSASPFPKDLLHVMRYAGANGIDAIMVNPFSERQAGLPFYGGKNTPDLKGTAIGEEDLTIKGDIAFVTPNRFSDDDLRVEQTWTETLPDADFEAPDGVWIGTGNASVRIKTDEEGVLHINAYPRGREMDEPVHSVSLPSDHFEVDPDIDEPGI